MGKHRDRKLSVLSMFGIGSVDKKGKKLTVFRLIRYGYGNRQKINGKVFRGDEA